MGIQRGKTGSSRCGFAGFRAIRRDFFILAPRFPFSRCLFYVALPFCLLLLAAGCSDREVLVRYHLTNGTSSDVRIQFLPEGEGGMLEEWNIAKGATFTREVTSSSEEIGTFAPTHCLQVVNVEGAKVQYCRGGTERGNLQVPEQWQKGQTTRSVMNLHMTLQDEIFNPSAEVEIRRTN